MCKETHFSFNGHIFQQTDRVVTSMVPVLSEKMPLWLRYVDVLNSFHPNIDFTREIEENNCISFLDVKIIRNGNDRLSMEVFLKDTDTTYICFGKLSCQVFGKLAH